MQLYEFLIRAEKISPLVIRCILFTIMYFSSQSIVAKSDFWNPGIS